MTSEETMSDLDFVASLEGTTNGETPEPVVTEPGNVQNEATVISEPENTNIELERLRRVIAADPNLRQVYESEMYKEYGESYSQPQQHFQQEQEQQVKEPALLPFEPDVYDPTDPMQQAQLVAHIVQQQLQPFHQFIQQQEAENQQLAQQAQQAQFEQQSSQVVNAIEGMVPGFKELDSLTNPNEEQQMVMEYAAKQFMNAVKDYPRGLWFNPKVLQEVAPKIAPKVKKLGQSLGLFQSQAQTSEGKQRDLYMEGSNAVPADTGNAFEKAYASDDVLGMINAIGL